MKAQINNENKAKFFALYWGQEVIRDTNNAGQICTYPVHQSNMYRFDESHLLLKPLSQISDEDAIKCGYNGAKQLLQFSSRRSEPLFELFDILRSKGYALPWMGLSVEEMTKAGWIKLIEV